MTMLKSMTTPIFYLVHGVDVVDRDNPAHVVCIFQQVKKEQVLKQAIRFLKDKHPNIAHVLTYCMYANVWVVQVTLA